MTVIYRAAWIVALCVASGPLWAQQTLYRSFGCPDPNNPGKAIDSTYEIWLYDSDTPLANKSWAAAQDFADDRDLRGFTGHLATFEDQNQEECVLEQAKLIAELGANQQAWIGLVQEPAAGEPAANWGWVIPKANWAPGDPIDLISGADYENWNNAEPNDASPGEDRGTIGRYGYELSNGWNDEADSRGSVVAFVIEYDVAALGPVVLNCPTGECIIEIPSANPQDNTIVLPTGNGGTADIEVYLIQEDCSALDTELLYDSREVTFAPGESIEVGNFLCDDEWILISSELNFFINSDVVEAEFEPRDFGIASEGCAANLPLPLADPLATDHIGWLTGREKWGSDDNQFERSANYQQDFDSGCGSSRGLFAGNPLLRRRAELLLPGQIVRRHRGGGRQARVDQPRAK